MTREFEEIIVEYPPKDLCTYPEYKGKPYFSIKYKEGNDHFIGYGTYKPEVFSRYLRDYFMPSIRPIHRDRTVQDFADRCRECGKTAITRAENDEILNEAWRLLMNVTEEDGVTTAEANGMLKLMNFFFYKYHGLKKKPDWVENVEARLANPMPEKYKMHPIKDGFPKTNSVRYLVQNIDGKIWDAEYDECQDNPEERFGEWAPTYKGGGFFDAEWRPYPEIVAWAELPKLYEEEDQEHESEADKMKEVGEWFGQGIEKGLKNTEEENK